MKRSLLLILIVAGLSTLANAQAPDTTLQPGMKKPDPAKRAARQLTLLEKQLHLTQDQVLQVQVILITETVALDSLHKYPSGDRRSDNHSRRAILQNADQEITDMLTDEQKPLYQQWKAQRRRSPYNSQ